MCLSIISLVSRVVKASKAVPIGLWVRIDFKLFFGFFFVTVSLFLAVGAVVGRIRWRWPYQVLRLLARQATLLHSRFAPQTNPQQQPFAAINVDAPMQSVAGKPGVMCWLVIPSFTL